MLAYKYVEKSKEKLTSVNDKNFEYVLNQTIEADIINKYSGIYCYKNLDESLKVSNKTKKLFLLISLEYKTEDVIRIEDDKVLVLKRAVPLEIIDINKEE